MAERRVLCLFYYFPPSGGAGALRCGAVVRELLALGWRADVVAPRNPVYPVSGEDLLEGIPSGIEVHRTSCLDPSLPLGLLRRWGASPEAVAALGRAVFVPDPQWGWAPFAGREADRLLSGRRFHALLSYGAPWTAHLTASRLVRRHAVPWVAAFADEWSTSAWSRAATPFHRRLQRHWEGRVLKRADAAAFPTRRMGERAMAVHPGLGKAFEIVGNGYDERDFAGREGRTTDRFTLLYAGTMYSVTTPFAILRAMARLLAGRSAWRSRLRLRVLGLAAPGFRIEAARLGLADLLSVEGPRPHGETVQAMLDAHALVDARADQPYAAAMCPVKLLEYLRTGRPVLGFYPDGEASDLLRRYPDCVLLAPGDVEGARRSLQAWLERWDAGRWPPAAAPRPGIEAFSRAAQVARLAAVLDRVAR